MMRALRKFPLALLLCALLSCAPAAAFGQKGDQKKDPPKQEKVVPKEDKQPRGNDRPHDNGDQNRNRDNNNNRRPPFSFFA
jgi:hypothetical protein